MGDWSDVIWKWHFLFPALKEKKSHEQRNMGRRDKEMTSLLVPPKSHHSALLSRTSSLRLCSQSIFHSFGDLFSITLFQGVLFFFLLTHLLPPLPSFFTLKMLTQLSHFPTKEQGYIHFWPIISWLLGRLIFCDLTFLTIPKPNGCSWGSLYVPENSSFTWCFSYLWHHVLYQACQYACKMQHT